MGANKTPNLASFKLHQISTLLRKPSFRGPILESCTYPMEGLMMTSKSHNVKTAKDNSPRSIYLNSNMTRRLSGHFSIFGLVFFVLKSLLGIARQWNRKKFFNFDPKTSGSC